MLPFLPSTFNCRLPTSLRSFSRPRYLCAACTCGQAISTALLREDGASPAAARFERGIWESGGIRIRTLKLRMGAEGCAIKRKANRG
jgi:hypothetical protein